ncbi:MAG TPA: preprotein translocase subunit SecG [bacterium]|nr:preprotein translocase subunit SecG [bacterium]HPT29422.1 preprotein translocase subunit SecG [bacterium]
MSWLKITQLVLAILLTISILLQNRGTGLGGVFGGSGGVYLAKRGLEKKLFWITIIVAILFFASSLSVVIF